MRHAVLRLLVVLQLLLLQLLPVIFLAFAAVVVARGKNASDARSSVDDHHHRRHGGGGGVAAEGGECEAREAGEFVELLGCFGDEEDSPCKVALQDLELHVNEHLRSVLWSSTDAKVDERAARQAQGENRGENGRQEKMFTSAQDLFVEVARALSSSPTFREAFWENEPFAVQRTRERKWKTQRHQRQPQQRRQRQPNSAMLRPVVTKDGMIAAVVSKHAHGNENNFFVGQDVGRGKTSSFVGASGWVARLVYNQPLSRYAIERRLNVSTWVTSVAEALHLGVAETVAGFEGAFGFPGGANVYITHNSIDVGAPLHTDRMNSFILQSEGSKRWRLYRPGDENATLPVVHLGSNQRGKSGDVLPLNEVGPIRLDAALEPGDLLYLPRGFPHRTNTRTIRDTELDGSAAQLSVSITLSLHTDGVDLTTDKLVDCLLMQSADGELQAWNLTRSIAELRRTLPVGFLRRGDASSHTQNHLESILRRHLPELPVASATVGKVLDAVDAHLQAAIAQWSNRTMCLMRDTPQKQSRRGAYAAVTKHKAKRVGRTSAGSGGCYSLTPLGQSIDYGAQWARVEYADHKVKAPIWTGISCHGLQSSDEHSRTVAEAVDVERQKWWDLRAERLLASPPLR